MVGLGRLQLPKSHPEWDVHFRADGNSEDGEVAHAEESSAEEHPAQLFLEQLGGTIWGELCGKKIARLDAHEFRRRGDLLEAGGCCAGLS